MIGAVRKESNGSRVILGVDGRIWQSVEINDLPPGTLVEFTVVQAGSQRATNVYAELGYSLFTAYGRLAMAALASEQLVVTRTSPIDVPGGILILVATHDHSTDIGDLAALQMVVRKIAAPKPIIEIWGCCLMAIARLREHPLVFVEGGKDIKEAHANLLAKLEEAELPSGQLDYQIIFPDTPQPATPVD